MNDKIRESYMASVFSDRISDVPRSFIREILKVTLDESIISFAGGMPSRALFPLDELKEAAVRAMDNFGTDILQYSNSEGYAGLREMISVRYKEKDGFDIPVENILITSGSQQGLDLLGKTFINDGDPLVIEEPGYLGAIQAFSMYRPAFKPVPVSDKGMDHEKLREVMQASKPKLIYTVPNFQNPSGISYTRERCETIADIIDGSSTLLIEDNPYGDLRFSGDPAPSFYKYIPDNAVLLGTFSKTVVPGFRLGWIVAGDRIMDKLIVAKQASDLHTTQLVQCIVYQYLKDNDIDTHIEKIRKAYGAQLRAMAESMDTFFPAGVSRTDPQGGMFIWAELPGNISTRALLEPALRNKVIFVPGDAFYVNRPETSDMRLNFSCVDEATIRIGIEKLGNAIRELL